MSQQIDGASPLGDRATHERSRASRLRLSVGIASALVLAGCNEGPIGEVMPESETGDLREGNSIRKWTDPTTGCAYLIYQRHSGNASTGGITIRFKSDGTADCPNGAAAKPSRPVPEGDAP